MPWFRDLWNKLFPARNPPRKVAPSWATFFSDQQYRDFIHLVETYFRGRQVPFRMGEGVVHLEETEDGAQQLGLYNLGQLCARHPQQDWPNVIADHFQTMDKSQREQRVLEERLNDFDRVEELLAVRLWPEDYLSQIDRAKLIHRLDLPGTVSALVFDLPSSIRNVTPEEAEAWRRSPEELFDIGLANVRENCIPDKSDQELAPGLTIRLLSDESFFVASHALLLEDHPECIGTHGTLVGIPHRHVLLAYPIEDLRVIQAINLLIPIVLGMEREGPGSVSPRLYWHHCGEFVDLPYRIEDQTLHFTPPEAFIEMLQLLSEGEDFTNADDEETA